MLPRRFRLPRVLIAETDPETQRRLKDWLKVLGYEAVITTTVGQALAELGRCGFALTFLDPNLDGQDGLDLLRQLQVRGGRPGPIILNASERDLPRVPEARMLGAQEFLCKPFQLADLEQVIKKVLLRPARTWPKGQDKEEGPARLQRELALCRSPRMRDVWVVMRQAAAVDVTVLIEGETGTGKDLVARAIHHFSDRCRASWIKVNCAAVPHDLLESELFGHERGAFTGAHRLKIGKFEAANRGTIFLDEIGDLHPALQAKLLHVLEDGTFSRVGGRAPVKVDVRVLAATNRDLEQEVQAHRFREDLFYRLAVMQIFVPPLRERMEEVPLLADYFVRRYAWLFHRRRFALSPLALERLGDHRFPGNVRELENLIKRMIILNDPALDRTPFRRTNKPEIAAPAAAPLCGNGHVPGTSAVPPTHLAESVASADRVPLKEIARAAARAAEREAIAQALEETGWNRLRAARLLKCSYRALLYKIKDRWFDARRRSHTDGRDQASKPSAPEARRPERARRPRRVFAVGDRSGEPQGASASPAGREDPISTPQLTWTLRGLMP
jgi:two-component system response regulator AtoC